MLQIHLHRHRVSVVACDGTLSISGNHVCDTAENAKYKVPVGIYHIELKYSKMHGRKVPFLMEAPGVCLAIGNGVFGLTDGRILLGTYIVPGCLKSSDEHFMQLYNRINQSLRRGHEVTLRITSSAITNS